MYIYTHMYAYIYIHIYIHIYIYIHTCTFMYKDGYSCAWSRILSDIYLLGISFRPTTCTVYTHTHSLHTQMHTPHTYIHTGSHSYILILIDTFLFRMSLLISSSLAFPSPLLVLSMHTRIRITHKCIHHTNIHTRDFMRISQS